MSRAQLVTLAIIPKVTGGISFLSSTGVIYDVLKDARKRQTTYHRLILGISVSDVLTSFCFFIGTWAMPKGSTWGALGSIGSCDFFGFIGQVGMAGAYLYNVVLTTYYLLLLKYRWNSHNLKKAEPCLHAVPWTISISVGITALVKNLYGSAFYVCWIGRYPANCDSPKTCVRGWNSEAYRWAFVFALVWASLLYMVIAMSMVYVSVRDLELKSKALNIKQEEETEDREIDVVTDEAKNIGNLEVLSEERNDERKEVSTGEQEVEQVGDRGGIYDGNDEEKNEIQPRGQEARSVAILNSVKAPTQTTTTTSKTKTKISKASLQKAMAKNTKKSKRIMVQAFLYFGAVCLTWTFATITRILLSTNHRSYFPLLVLGTIFTPLQGLFNCLIYFRYRIFKWYKIKYLKKGEKKHGSPGQKQQEPLIEKNEAEFNLQEWLAARDKTGLRGANTNYESDHDHDGGPDKVPIFNTTVSDKIRVSDLSEAEVNSNNLRQQQQQETVNVPEWMTRILIAAEYNNDQESYEDDGENDYY